MGRDHARLAAQKAIIDHRAVVRKAIGEPQGRRAAHGVDGQLDLRLTADPQRRYPWW